MTTARHSFGPDYNCQHEWPPSCFVQCGGSDNRGFFFESFPRSPDSFLRGDSKISIEDAEEKVWKKYQKEMECPLNHTDPKNFEKRTYKNGCGFCINCGFFGSEIFPPSEICCKCGTNTYYSFDKNGKCYCENCEIPEELKQGWQKQLVSEESLENMTDEEFQEGLKQVFEHIISKSEGQGFQGS